MKSSVILAGVVGSPYSRKMRALLRYRRVPFEFLPWGAPEQQELPAPPLPLMPALYLPGENGYEAISDSTFQLRRLEREFEGRAALPPDSVVAFLDFLIEDYADEWVTKMMFHYRWSVDEWNASRILPRWNLAAPEEFVRAFRIGFGRRQVDRLALVGSNETTGPLIEAGYVRLLEILEALFQKQRFVTGGRPGMGDFGLFGQLSQLVQVEPTSQALARMLAPRVVAWCDVIEDLSGGSIGEEDWSSRAEMVRAVRPLLEEIGRTYTPFLRANAEALERGADLMECVVDGKSFRQAPFRYQGKCLDWLREAYGLLTEVERKDVDAALAGTGCEELF